MSENPKISKRQFKAEVKQLLDILAHSLYTNKEIFLRELISNASDALDKLRFETNRGVDIKDADLPFEIRITFDKDKHLLTVSDTGIGMNAEEIIANIGTIAKSGSTEFLKQASEQKESLDNLIGQFGVGFYSVFMAAERVVIRTQSYKKDEVPVEWRSEGSGTYQILNLDKELQRGTSIEIHLKQDAMEFADKDRLEALIKKHSNFIQFPIFVGEERINLIPAIWREPKSSLEQAQYNDFYKFLTHDTDDPFETIHIAVDAPIQFNSLLFVPKKSFDIPGLPRERQGLDLFVRRVLIQRGNKDLIPEYLGFVRGIVDSEDLPLNISRETLQENRIVAKISSTIIKQILSHLERLSKDDKERYEEFWKEHGKYFKLGYSDFLNRDRYAPLLRFNSSTCEDASALISFDDYIDRTKPDQKEIYFAFGTGREAIALNPHMEIFKSKGIEVLYLFEPLDEFAMDGLGEYRGHKFVSVEHVDPKSLEKFDSAPAVEESKPLNDEDKEIFGGFLAKMNEILGERVTDVRISSRLSESPCCTVNPDGQMTSSMLKIMQIVSKDTSIPKKVLEVNDKHELIKNLFTIFKADPNDTYLASVVEQLFESSLLLEGYLMDPHAMVGRIHRLLDQSSGWYLGLKEG